MAKFSDIVGQEELKQHIRNAIEMDKVSHAYIINGERNAGKEFIARLFAMTLQCEKGGTEPCGECHSCKQAISRNQPDIIYVSHEKPNTIGVEDIRGQINNDIGIKPYSSPRKIYIMNEGEKMTPQAQNALLKTLEEPPAYAVILVLTIPFAIVYHAPDRPYSYPYSATPVVAVPPSHSPAPATTHKNSPSSAPSNALEDFVFLFVQIPMAIVTATYKDTIITCNICIYACRR